MCSTGTDTLLAEPMKICENNNNSENVTSSDHFANGDDGGQLVTHLISSFRSEENPFSSIDKNEFQNVDVETELVLEFEKRTDVLKKFKLQGDRKWTCECNNGQGRDGRRKGVIVCFDMSTCRNLGANLSCPPTCGVKSGATCWNQNFPNPSVTFSNPKDLLLFESKFTGLGVLTTKEILRGQISGEFIGVVARGHGGPNNDIYAAQIAQLPYHITPIIKGSYTRFYNHCGISPNHKALSFLTCAGPRILLVASKDILAGQECTWNYGEYWHRTFMEMGGGNCSCLNCRELLGKCTE